MTQVSVRGADFAIDNVPTHAGRFFQGKRVEGLLFNVRTVQATFDDSNTSTRRLWAYPDTGIWEPQRNTDELCAALPSWRDHGVLAFTVNIQGGGARYFPDVYDTFDNNGFTPDGDLKPAYAQRLEQVFARADDLGMVVIAGIFYWKHVSKLNGEPAMRRAAHSAVQFIVDSGHRNVMIELANENMERWPWEILRPSQAHRFLSDLRSTFASHNLLYSTSVVAHQLLPPEPLIEASDYILIHGNGMKPEEMAPYVDQIRTTSAFRSSPKPILWNEDSPNVGNLDAALDAGTSWGYYDQGFGSGWWGDIWVDYRSREREQSYAELSGFQTPPINWTINTDLKRAFFGRVAEITGNPARSK
jgi:hypothetical protein